MQSINKNPLRFLTFASFPGVYISVAAGHETKRYRLQMSMQHQCLTINSFTTHLMLSVFSRAVSVYISNLEDIFGMALKSISTF